MRAGERRRRRVVGIVKEKMKRDHLFFDLDPTMLRSDQRIGNQILMRKERVYRNPLGSEINSAMFGRTENSILILLRKPIYLKRKIKSLLDHFS
jgi:hypothetical protein